MLYVEYVKEMNMGNKKEGMREVVVYLSEYEHTQLKLECVEKKEVMWQWIRRQVVSGLGLKESEKQSKTLHKEQRLVPVED